MYPLSQIENYCHFLSEFELTQSQIPSLNEALKRLQLSASFADKKILQAISQSISKIDAIAYHQILGQTLNHLISIHFPNIELFIHYLEGLHKHDWLASYEVFALQAILLTNNHDKVEEINSLFLNYCYSYTEETVKICPYEKGGKELVASLLALERGDTFLFDSTMIEKWLSYHSFKKLSHDIKSSIHPSNIIEKKFAALLAKLDEIESEQIKLIFIQCILSKISKEKVSKTFLMTLEDIFKTFISQQKDLNVDFFIELFQKPYFLKLSLFELDVFFKEMANVKDSLMLLEIDTNFLPVTTNSQSLPKDGDLEELKKRFYGKDRNVTFPLSKEKIDCIFDQYYEVNNHCDKWKNYSLEQLVSLCSKFRKNGNLSVLELVAIGRLAMHHLYGIYLYSTQILSVLSFLNEEKGLIAQILTGQGKSPTIALLSLVEALQKKSVHITCSSPSLAIRDFEKYKLLFDTFTITSSHICHPNPDLSHFEGQILYGTATDYEFAIMRTKISFTDYFAHQKKFANVTNTFDVVIVDESDNLMKDTLLNSARIAVPKNQSEHWIYSLIYQFYVKQASKIVKQNQKIPQRLFMASLLDTSSESIAKLAMAILETYQNPEQIIEKLKLFLDQETTDEQKRYLSIISDDQLIIWIGIVDQAVNRLQLNKEYVIQKNDDGKRSIKIVDKDNTGKILQGMRWNNGLHDFLELKHNLSNEVETIVPISYSHSLFYNKYQTIYGLTGTLGSTNEREEIQTIYGVDCVDIPPHISSIRIDNQPIICNNRKQYYSIISSILEKETLAGRPVLVLTESIKQSEFFFSFAKARNLNPQLFNEKQLENEQVILANAGKSGCITIATNNATRGTDIILESKSLEAGGLVVLLTIPPQSERVYKQAIGRAGRQGQPGTTHMVFMAEDLNYLDWDGWLEKLKEKESGVKKTHIATATIENFTDTVIEEFWEKLHVLKNVLENDFYIREKATLLQKLHLHRMPEIKETLNDNEKELVTTFYKLLKDSSTTIVSFQDFLISAGRLLIENLLEKWSIHFFHTYEKNILPNVREQSLEEVKGKIYQLFENSRSFWETYLSSPDGLILYLEQITTINLSHL